MARVYVRRITRSTMYQKISILLAGTGVWKISSVACGLSPIKIEYSDYLKSLISRIYVNDVYVFFNKILLSLQSHLLLCKHGFRDVSVTLYNVSVMLSPALSK